MLSLNHYRPLNAIMCFSFEFSVIFALTLTFCVILYVLPKLAARAYDISLHVFLFVLFVKHMIFLRTPNSEFSCSFIHNTLVVFFFFFFLLSILYLPRNGFIPKKSGRAYKFAFILVCRV